MFAEAIFTSDTAQIQIFLLDCYNSLSINLSPPVSPESFIHVAAKGNLIPNECLMASTLGKLLNFSVPPFPYFIPSLSCTYLIGSLKVFNVHACKVHKIVPCM